MNKGIICKKKILKIICLDTFRGHLIRFTIMNEHHKNYNNLFNNVIDFDYINTGRDLLWHDLIRESPCQSSPEWLSAEDICFILHTRYGII